VKKSVSRKWRSKFFMESFYKKIFLLLLNRSKIRSDIFPEVIFHAKSEYAVQKFVKCVGEKLF